MHLACIHASLQFAICLRTKACCGIFEGSAPVLDNLACPLGSSRADRDLSALLYWLQREACGLCVHAQGASAQTVVCISCLQSQACVVCMRKLQSARRHCCTLFLYGVFCCSAIAPCALLNLRLRTLRRSLRPQRVLCFCLTLRHGGQGYPPVALLALSRDRHTLV